MWFHILLQVIPDKVYDAYYKLTRPELQIRAYVDDGIVIVADLQSLTVFSLP